jgi:hypothetical protein
MGGSKKKIDSELIISISVNGQETSASQSHGSVYDGDLNLYTPPSIFHFGPAQCGMQLAVNIDSDNSYPRQASLTIALILMW